MLKTIGLEERFAMEQRNAAIRKKRVRAQQNLVTALCLVCMVFTVGWSAYAAVLEKNKPAAEPVKEKTAPVQEEPTPTPEEETSSEDEDLALNAFAPYATGETAEAHPYATAADTADDLGDAVFIGDSRTVGMMNSTDKPMATFICAVGLDIDKVLTSTDIMQGDGTTGTLQQALSAKQFGRVFISFGTNEMGWPYIDTFKEHYTEMVKTIKGYQPNAKIYLIGILPVSASQDAKGELVNNTNASTFTKAIEEIAGELGVEYLDCSEAVVGEDGKLPDEASPDGIHMTADYCLYWQNYIIDHT